MDGKFESRTVLIAGGTGALGQKISLAFLNQSAKVTVTFRRSDEYAALSTAAGERASFLDGNQVDATNPEAIQKLVSNTVAKFGGIDILVNAVGAYAGGTPLWQTDFKVFEQMLTLNLRSGFELCHAVVPVMLKQGSGAIVNIASQAAVNHAAGAAAYSASKAAAVAMIDSLAADLKNTGIRANTILPSIIDTDANRAAMPGADFSKWPKPEEIAQVVIFLCSNEARLISGASVPVYGSF